MSPFNTHPQLPLGLALKDSARFGSYFPGQNREAVQGLRSAAAGRGESLVYIAGPAGRGKTHLLQAACHLAAEHRRSSGYLPVQELLELSVDIFQGLEQLDLVCLDDAQALAGLDDWERGLFDLFNRVREHGGTLLVTAEQVPARAGFELPDLVSRLGWGVSYVLKPLADDEVLAALSCRARGRGLELPEETAGFLLKRIPRDLPSVFDLLDRLDEASMIEQRRLTIPFVKSVLEQVS
jgi:DnaA family protein